MRLDILNRCACHEDNIYIEKSEEVQGYDCDISYR